MSTPEKKTRISAPYRRTAGSPLTGAARLRAAPKRMLTRRVGVGRSMVRRRSRFTRRPRVRRFARRRGHKAISGGLNRIQIRNPGGVPDRAMVKIRYQTTSSFTSSGAGAPSFLQIKQNSIYRPYPGNTDSCANYQRMYAQYRKSLVVASKVTVTFWTGTNGTSSVPFRTVIIPCTAVQYTAYSAYTNISSLWGVPHARQAEYSPGGQMPRLTGYTTTAALAVAQKHEEALDVSSPIYVGFAGADPTTLQYFLVGYQAFAGTTAIPTQAQVQIEYYVKFYEPVATVEQQLDTNYWGNEEVPPAKIQPEEKKESFSLQATEPEEFEFVKVKKTAVSSKK